MKLAFMSAAHVHADAYVSCLKSIPDVEILGIADHDAERGKAFASRYGLPFFENYDALLAQKPDGVLITSENSYHKALSLKAAEAGVHILCEKPLATNVKDATAIVRAAREAKILLMTAFPMRFSVPVRGVRDELLQGKLGNPLCFNASNQGQLPPKDRAWFTDPVLAGGGAIIDHVVHLADVMRWYLGMEVVEVYAATNRIFHAHEVKIETGAMVSLQFESGVFATINCSWSRPSTWPSWGGLSFDLITDRGAVHVDAFKQNLTVFGAPSAHQGSAPATEDHDWSSAHGDGGSGPRWLYWGSDSNQMMIEEFITAIHERRTPLVTGEDGLHAVQIVEAAYRSIQAGRPIRI
jgi:predicted dehydrogenase